MRRVKNIFTHANQIQTMGKFLPLKDQEYLEAKGLQYSQVQESGKNGLILQNYHLPNNKYHVNFSSLLIFMPAGYSDVPPDMFYTYPALILLNGGTPMATTTGLSFYGFNWQQWSRHLNNGDWRAGIDGVWSYLNKVNEALRKG